MLQCNYFLVSMADPLGPINLPKASTDKKPKNDKKISVKYISTLKSISFKIAGLYGTVGFRQTF